MLRLKSLSNKAKNNNIKKQFSAGIFAGGCILARNCQQSNQMNQLEPTKVRAWDKNIVMFTHNNYMHINFSATFMLSSSQIEGFDSTPSGSCCYAPNKNSFYNCIW